MAPDDASTSPPTAATGPGHVALGLASAATGTLAGLLRAGTGHEPREADGEGDAAVDLAVGLAFTAASVGGAALDVTSRTVGGLWTVARGVGSLPGVDLVTAPLRGTVDGLVERGRTERAASQQAASATVAVAIDRTTTDLVPAATDRLLDGTLQGLLAQILPVAIQGLEDDPDLLMDVVDSVLPGVLGKLGDDPDALLGLVNGIVDRVLPDILDRLGSDPDALLTLVDALLPKLLPVALEQIGNDPDALIGLVDGMLPQLLDAVLPVALDQLGEDPTVVRNLVIDQSGGMATEAANTVRARAVAGDEIIDRITRRILRRPTRPLPPEPVSAPPVAPRPPEALPAAPGPAIDTSASPPDGTAAGGRDEQTTVPR